MSRPHLPTITNVVAAARRIAGEAEVTPLLRNRFLDERAGGHVFLKAETLQRTGSFKFRGAFNALSSLTPEQRTRGVVAASSGNHAQGVAEAARVLVCPATLVMPSDAPLVKRLRAERSGARIVTFDRANEDRDEVAERILAETGATLIHPYDNRDVIAGQGTVGLEVARALGVGDIRPDMLIVPCGGGGLSAGTGMALRASFPECATVLVEPDGFDDYRRSLASGHRRTNATASGSVCDALMAPSPGSIGFAINRRNGATGVVVSDDEALAAVAFAFHELKLVVEPGGAVALAALLAGKVDGRGRVVVVVLTGGNIDDAMLARALAA